MSVGNKKQSKRKHTKITNNKPTEFHRCKSFKIVQKIYENSSKKTITKITAPIIVIACTFIVCYATLELFTVNKIEF